MPKVILFVLAGVSIAALLIHLSTLREKKKKKKKEREKQRKRAIKNANVSNDITRLRKGGVLKLPPFGSQRSPIETYVEERHRYSDGEGFEWWELSCAHGRRELLIEWSKEGRELYITAGFEDENPSLSDLNLKEDDLIRFDEDKRGEFNWGGTSWHFDESGENRFYENDGSKVEEYYGWSFESKDQSRFLNIEKWQGARRFKVYHLWLIDQRGIEIYEAGEG